jgi:hypothetical protein
LFLDELRTELSRLKARRDNGKQKALEDFHARLGRLTFFDPACGCGNFLVIAYRELRLLEIEVLRELFPRDIHNLRQGMIDIGYYTKVNVNQFYGIEIEEFPARIAEIALWMTDHIMNARLSAEFGESYLRIPLKTSPNILHGDALETDWAALLPPENCHYILGNSPFIGQSMQTDAQRQQMAKIFQDAGGSLDYVSAWFFLAGKYIRTAKNNFPRIGFVATSSICQGEQVHQLWPKIFFNFRLEICFAHQTFEWMSEARGKAHVHCVIIGLCAEENEPKLKKLYVYEDIKSDPEERVCEAINAYLIDATSLSNRHITVSDRQKSISGAPFIRMGSKIVDGGYYVFSAKERDSFIALEPKAKELFRPFIGAYEAINGEERFILYLQDTSLNQLRNMQHVLLRVQNVAQFRRKSKKSKTRDLAEYPTRFEVSTVPESSFLMVPETSSERRSYVPMIWANPPAIPTNATRIIPDATLVHFSILTSRMHMAWLRYVGGKLKSDYRYSIGIVYNNFPWPDMDDAAREKLRRLAQAVLDARAAHQGATLADLYDPDVMPPDLRKAHQALDLAVDRLYRKEPFASDRARVEHLFGMYEKLTANLLMGMAAPKKTRRRKSL